MINYFIEKKMLLYLKIIQDMERTHPDFYQEFRNHKDWELGLTHTISMAETLLGEEE